MKLKCVCPWCLAQSAQINLTDKTHYVIFNFFPAADDSPPSFYDVMGLSKLRNDIRTTKKELRNPAIMIFKICCICLGCLCLGSCELYILNCANIIVLINIIVACAAIVFLLYGALPISLLVVGKLLVYCVML